MGLQFGPIWEGCLPRSICHPMLGWFWWQWPRIWAQLLLLMQQWYLAVYVWAATHVHSPLDQLILTAGSPGCCDVVGTGQGRWAENTLRLSVAWLALYPPPQLLCIAIIIKTTSSSLANKKVWLRLLYI